MKVWIIPTRTEKIELVQVVFGSSQDLTNEEEAGDSDGKAEVDGGGGGGVVEPGRLLDQLPHLIVPQDLQELLHVVSFPGDRQQASIS